MNIDETYVRARLDAAGRTILMLPDQVMPKDYGSNWPEILREAIDGIQIVKEINEKGEVREVLKVIKPGAKPIALRASLREITEMGEVIYNWQPRLAAYCLVKRIPWVARSLAKSILLDPKTGKQIFGATKLAEYFKTSRQSIYNWNDDGVRILTQILNKNSTLQKL